MANQIKRSSEGLALQVTKPARAAGLVEETSDGEATRLADVWVYGFDDLLVVVDADRVTAADRAALVATAARDTDSVYGGHISTVSVAGNGYQVQLPSCEAAGFRLDDRAPVVPRQGLLVIHDGTHTRLAEDLGTLREEQVGITS
jgi:hypothetical protein